MESNVNTYKITQNNKEYTLTASIVQNSVRLMCKNNSNTSIKFCRDYTVEQLKQLDQIFNTIQTPLQALEYIDKALRLEKVSITEDAQEIKINFFLQVEDIPNQTEIPIQETNTITTTTTTDAYYNTNIDISSYNQADLITATNIENYDTTAYQQTDAQYTGIIDNTDNYLQNIDTANTVDTGFDFSNIGTTQEVSNQYEDTTSTQYNEYTSTQPISTPVENYQTYETTQNYEQYTSNIQTTSTDVPYITPVEEDTSNKILETATISKTDNYSDERLNKIEGETNNIRNQHVEIKNQLDSLSGQLHEYQNKISSMQKNKAQNEINALRAENQLIKQEINNLKRQNDEARILRAQLSELEPLRKKAAETEVLRTQLSELNSLRLKVAELSNVKSQLNEINNLKMQMSQLGMREQMNNFQKEFELLQNLKNKQAEEDSLRRKVKELESIKIQYEQEITSLRESQARMSQIEKEREIEERNSRLIRSKGMDSRQLLFEEKTEQICVKGDIIHSTEELELLTRKINKYNQKITLNLLYKATADSDKAEAFHAKCDDAESTLVLIETDKGKRFGGYTTCTWGGNCIEKKDKDAFVFSLDKMKTYDNIPEEEAIACYPKFGPVFLGCQIRIFDDAFSKGGTTFEKGLNFKTEENYELTDGDREFNVKEIEVYEVIPS